MPDLPPADLDLRLVRYFTVVAEHRHFGRAAESLRVAQPSLSRQIRHLEQQLGARLLDRTSQGSRLTEAGEVFLPQAKALLRSAAQAAAHTRAAARPGLERLLADRPPAGRQPRARRAPGRGHRGQERAHRGRAGRGRHPRGGRRRQPRPDLTTIPLHGVEPSHVVLATRAGDRSRLVAAFRTCAEAHLTGPG